MGQSARFELSYGGQRLPVELPASWLGTVAAPRPVRPPADIAALVAGALERPIGSPPLAQLARPGQRVAIIVDDYTRGTPAHLLLPPLLTRLRAAGVEREGIRIVVALGTHRPMTEAELLAKLGEEILRGYEVVNVPATVEAEMRYLGRSSTGIPAWVNRAVADAELRIGLGMITPHLDAGFSGGAKILLPGVCSARTVDAFHVASTFFPENQLGNVEAPLRQTLEQFVGERVPLHFILNVVLTLDGVPYRCVAGHPIEAHRAGVAHARTVFGVPVERRYPVVVAGCAPYDFDLWQSIKGIWAGDLLVEDGGTLIAVTAAPEGNSNYPLVPHYAGREPEELRRAIERGEVEDGMQAATGVMFGTLKRRVRLALVSTGLTPTDAAAMGAAHHRTVEEAIREAVMALPTPQRAAAVAVLPRAGILLPLLPGASHESRGKWGRKA